jgi:hypothetical protein
MIMKVELGVNLHSQIFDAFSSNNQGFTSFVVKKEQVRFPRKGDNSSLVGVELHKIRDATSMKTIYISL